MNHIEELNGKIKQTPQMIIDKEFKKGFRGYKLTEVDKYLDIIIEDYYTYESVIDSLLAENQKLKLKIEELNQKASMMAPNTNLDILQRLNNLERHVFGDRLTKSTPVVVKLSPEEVNDKQESVEEPKVENTEV